MTVIYLLLTLAAPLAARVLMSLGFSVLTIGGVSIAANSIKGQLLGVIGQAPASALQLAGLAGVWDGLGMVLGAVSFAVALWGITSSRRILGVS